MSVFLPDVTAPKDALLARISALIREGFPGLTRPGEVWAEDQKAPYGHWLFPEGTGIYRYDIPETAQAPCVLLGYAEDAEPRVGRDSRTWDLYPQVVVMWQDDADITGWRKLCDVLARYLIGDFRGGDFVSLSRDRLTGPGVRVFHVRQFEVEPLGELAGRSVFTLGMQVFCAGEVAG